MRSSRWVVLRLRRLPLSVRFDRRVPRVLALLALAILGVAVANAAVGDYPLSPSEALRIIGGLETGETGSFVVWSLRLPRTAVAVAAGVGLGVSGAILQGLTRNPLAAPSIVGITQGAALAAVTAVVLLPGLPGDLLPLLTFAGAAGAAFLVYLLAWRGGLAPGRLILVGIGVGAVATALTTALITFGEIYRIEEALVWMVGSVHARDWGDAGTLLLWQLVFVPLALVGCRALNGLNLGEEVARGLGARIETQRGLLLLVSVALAGSAVAVAGAVTFVGLMAPHLSRQLVGPAHENLLPTSALMGGLIVVAADLAGRAAVPSIEIPCGILTGVLGAPYFAYLLYRGGRP